MNALNTSTSDHFTVPSSSYRSDMQAVAVRGYETSQYATPKRTLHVVDIENLLGDPFFSDMGAAQKTFERYQFAAEWREGDLMLVAASRWLYRQLAFAASGWPCRLYGASGRDGADEKLLSEANQPRLIQRFGRVVIGSGDRIFCRLIRSVRSVGAEAWMVAEASSASAQMQAEVDTFVSLSNTMSDRQTTKPLTGDLKELAEVGNDL